MAEHILTLDWYPTLVNRLLRCHWAKRSRLLRGDVLALTVDSLNQSIPKARGKRRVRLTVLYSNPSHRPDGDGLLKSLLDSLTRSGLLLDDNPDCCVVSSVEYEKAPRKGLRIILEDIP